MSINPAWAAIALSMLLAVLGGAGHVINYVLEQDTMSRVEIEAEFDDERDDVEEWVARLAAQHDRDRSDMKAAILALDERVDNDSATIAGIQASIAALDVHISGVQSDIQEVKMLLNQLIEKSLDP